MSEIDTKSSIVHTLRRTDDPALSAKTLADKLDVSVRTINNHIDHLVEEDRVATTQIGNATAYYIPFDDLPNHTKPDNSCRRCGRAVDEVYDFAKLDASTYFARNNYGEETADFYIFCRFCYDDFVSWIEDPGTIGEYPYVHAWDLPRGQLAEVRDDPEVVTEPGEPKYLDDAPQLLLAYIEDNEDEWERGVPKYELLEYAVEEGLLEVEADQALSVLVRAGYVHQPVLDCFRRAK